MYFLPASLCFPTCPSMFESRRHVSNPRPTHGCAFVAVRLQGGFQHAAMAGGLPEEYRQRLEEYDRRMRAELERQQQRFAQALADKVSAAQSRMRAALSASLPEIQKMPSSSPVRQPALLFSSPALLIPWPPWFPVLELPSFPLAFTRRSPSILLPFSLLPLLNKGGHCATHHHAGAAP